MKKFISILGLVCAVAGFVRAEIVIVKEGAKSTDSPGVTVPAPSSADAPRGDSLELLNGDVFHGTFLSLDAKNGARWQHPSVKQVMEMNHPQPDRSAPCPPGWRCPKCPSLFRPL